MSKHLPGRDGEVPPIVTSGIDFSTDSLLRQPTGSRAGSAIQWVGAGAQSGPGLPVSALLRQLCASRESVIRANVQVCNIKQIFLHFLYKSISNLAIYINTGCSRCCRGCCPRCWIVLSRHEHSSKCTAHPSRVGQLRKRISVYAKQPPKIRHWRFPLPCTIFQRIFL